MARTCVWCGADLPEPEHKGHRRREFCKPPKNCKQQHYLWHKQMKRDADALAEPFWHTAYLLLVEQYKILEKMEQERLEELQREKERLDNLEEIMQYYVKKYEYLQIDYAARLKALGLNESDIEEFNKYWRTQ